MGHQCSRPDFTEVVLSQEKLIMFQFSDNRQTQQKKELEKSVQSITRDAVTKEKWDSFRQLKNKFG